MFLCEQKTVKQILGGSTQMKLLVTNRQSIERGFLVRSSYALISIRDPGTTRAHRTKSTPLRHVLHLAFHDAEPTQTMRLRAKVKLMTLTQARQIWCFVDRHKSCVGAFVVHCHQGMSRSPAVAAALAIYLTKMIVGSGANTCQTHTYFGCCATQCLIRPRVHEYIKKRPPPLL